MKKIWFGQSFNRIKKKISQWGIIGIIIIILGFLFLNGYISFKGDNSDNDIVLNNLNKLKLGVNETYYENLFGKPEYINILSGGYTEYIYDEDLYYIQTIFNKNMSTLLYSITSKGKNIKINDGLTLCKTFFTEARKEFTLYSDEIIQSGFFLTNRNASYYEKFGGDGVHGFKYYVISFNDVGCRMISNDAIQWEDPKDIIINTMPINTYSVYSIDLEGAQIDFGPNFLQINWGLIP